MTATQIRKPNPHHSRPSTVAAHASLDGAGRLTSPRRHGGSRHAAPERTVRCMPTQMSRTLAAFSVAAAGLGLVACSTHTARTSALGPPSTSHPTLTAETHNHPSGVAPYPGAATGTGGRIRDNQVVGRGGLVHDDPARSTWRAPASTSAMTGSSSTSTARRTSATPPNTCPSSGPTPAAPRCGLRVVPRCRSSSGDPSTAPTTRVISRGVSHQQPEKTSLHPRRSPDGPPSPKSGSLAHSRDRPPSR